MQYITQNHPNEWTFVSAKARQDAFNEIELDVVFVDENGKETCVPAFWAGGNIWRVRFSAPIFGRFEYRTVCTDASDQGLHGLTGSFVVLPYEGGHPLYQHGSVRVAADRRHFEHSDGTPFFWLGDTWWMGFCQRMRWPCDFQKLAVDRLEKGFTVVQLVAGLYPDMPPFDERGANEAGFPWEKNYTQINPVYFDYVDQRIRYLVDAGLVPCIVGCWGYFLKFMGLARMKQHWRNLVARYGAYPVFWCLAGEAVMPYYLSENPEADQREQKQGWTEIAKYVRQINAFNNPITIHPPQYGRDQIEDPHLIDFEMVQTGHSSHATVANTIKTMQTSLAREPKMPVLVGETCYEGIVQASREEIQRLLFWTSILSGAAGHTYGANGIWQVNEKDKPFGLSPHGSSWGDISWEEAARLPGSEHLGVAKKILEDLPWWKFEAHQEWIAAPANADDPYLVPYIAGVPGKVRVVYYHQFNWGQMGYVKALEADVVYHARFHNPSTGDPIAIGKVMPDGNGTWQVPKPPVFRDWVLVLEAE